MSERGYFNNRNRAKQLISFRGLNYTPNITPTDIDFTIEYHNAKAIFGEFKYLDAKLYDAQKWLLERYVNNFVKAGKQAIAFIARHDVSDCEQDVHAAETIIDKYYYKNEWRTPEKVITVKTLCDWFIGENVTT